MMREMLVPAVRDALRRLRSQREWTQVELAQKAGVEVTTVHRVENTKKMPDYKPDLQSVEKLAKALGYHTLASFLSQIEVPPNGTDPDTSTSQQAGPPSAGTPLQGSARPEPTRSPESDLATGQTVILHALHNLAESQHALTESQHALIAAIDRLVEARRQDAATRARQTVRAKTHRKVG